MDKHNYIYFLIGAVVVLSLVLVLLKSSTDKAANYKLKNIMTDNEKMCFNYLIQIYPEYYIFPQVSMGALLEPNVQRNVKVDGKNHYSSLRGKIQSNIVDFVICNKQLEPVFIIELDDNSHNNKVAQDALRDKNFSDVGLATLRFRNVKGKFPTRSELDKQLKEKKK